MFAKNLQNCKQNMTKNNNRELNSKELDHQYFVKTLAAFRFFSDHLSKHVETAKAYYASLPESYKNLISEFNQNLNKVQSCIDHNSELIDIIIQNSAPDIFSEEHASEEADLPDHNDVDAVGASEENDENGGDFMKNGTNFFKHSKQNFNETHNSSQFGPFTFTNNDMDKVRSVLKQFVRDWSAEGKPERDVCYQPVIDDIVELFNPKKIVASDIRILVPGAGLGRLAWELAHCGYRCQGNEWSLHMLIPAYFILNTCKRSNQYKLYPWISQFCNNMSREDQLASVNFPDVCPNILSDVEFSMAAGDFVEIYTERDVWDCIATVFFMDTAHNILRYLDTIWQILKPGGYWINFGPLLYHFCDVPGEESLELSYDELRLAIVRIGFETIKEKTGIQTGYTQNPKSMLAYTYNCVYGLYRKPLTSKKTESIIEKWKERK